MALEELTFSGTFNDFPSGPHPGRDELMQFHNETKDYLNNTLKPFVDQQNNLAVNGYAKLPNGLIIQWGGVTINAGANTGQVVNLPIPFPNTILRVSACCTSINSYGGAVRGDDNKSTVKCWSNNNGAAIEFIVIGY